MKKIKFLSVLSVLIVMISANIALSASTELPKLTLQSTDSPEIHNCKIMLEIIKTAQYNGVIQDSKYKSGISTSTLEKLRKIDNIKKQNLEDDIKTIEYYILNDNESSCLGTSARVVDSLNEYAKIASNKELASEINALFKRVPESNLFSELIKNGYANRDSSSKFGIEKFIPGSNLKTKLDKMDEQMLKKNEGRYSEQKTDLAKSLWLFVTVKEKLRERAK